jgi:hypothetical protein
MLVFGKGIKNPGISNTPGGFHFKEAVINGRSYSPNI